MTTFQPLESRRLFAGGIDPSFGGPVFGGSSAAAFDAPGIVPTLHGRAVDPRGRVVLVGTAGDVGVDPPTRMFIARLDADGERDPAFGGFGFGAGVGLGTPRGLVALTDVVALRDGSGYVVVGETRDGILAGGGRGYRLVKFDNSGRVNASFGRNGVAPLDRLVPFKLLEAPDGKLILVGEGDRDEAGTPNLYALRFAADGTPDPTYAAGRGEALIASGDRSEQFRQDEVNLASAEIDAGGRLLVSFTSRSTRNSDGDGVNARTTLRNATRRLRGDGTPDPKFVGVDGFNAQFASDDPNAERPQQVVAVTRGDGQVAVLRRERDVPVAPVTITLNGARGQLAASTAPAVRLDALVPGFIVADMRDGALLAVDGNRLVVAGTIDDDQIPTPALPRLNSTLNPGPGRQTRAPAILRLNADLTLDITFGTNGVVTLPAGVGSIAVATEATDLAPNADGTLTAIARPALLGDTQPLDVLVVRVFQDDRPVVAVRSTQRKGDQIRVSVSVRGINPIDPATLDAGDLRLVAASGTSAKPRVLSTADAGDGDRLVTYGVNRPRGTYSVVTIGNQIEDASDGRNRGRTIATVTA